MIKTIVGVTQGMLYLLVRRDKNDARRIDIFACKAEKTVSKVSIMKNNYLIILSTANII